MSQYKLNFSCTGFGKSFVIVPRRHCDQLLRAVNKLLINGMKMKETDILYIRE